MTNATQLIMRPHIHHRAMTESVKNVEVVQSTADDPKVPRGVNLVFICDVLHHVKDRAAFLAKLAGEVAAGTRLALIEFKEGDLPQGPPAQIKISKRTMIELLRSAGFALVREAEAALPYQYLLEFRR